MDVPNDRVAWNEAVDRLGYFLDGFVLSDRIYEAQLELRIVDEARKIYTSDKSRSPTAITMELAQRHLGEWLAHNLGEDRKAGPETLASGTIALLLSRMNRDYPDAFLAKSAPEELRKSLRQTLLVTGPDLNISSMTPRHLDYGPMLDLARQTWHRFNFKEALMAVLFWACVYGILYGLFTKFL